MWFILFSMACTETVDPKIEGAIVALEKFATDAAGRTADCDALKSEYNTLQVAATAHVLVAGSPLETRLKDAVTKSQAIVDACVPPTPVEPTPTEPAPTPTPTEPTAQ